MSDDQQMTNSIEAHTVPSTSAKDLQVKIGKNRRAASTAKKLKKQSIQRRDVNRIEAIGPTKSVADTTPSNQSNQERSAGSVVITIRLLKMESTRSFDVNSVGGTDDSHTDIYSNNNIPMGRSHQPPPVYNSEIKTIDASQNIVNAHENSKQNQNNSCKVDNNNVSLNQSETIPATNIWMTENNGTIVNNFWNCDNGNNSNTELNERNSIKKQHVNRALRSEASICDKVQQQNCTSQPEQLTNATMNCLAHTINTINLTDTSATVFGPSPSQISDNNKIKCVQDNANAFISSNLIGSVSPYPHHIPIANIIRSDCLSGVVDERKFTVYIKYYYAKNRFVYYLTSLSNHNCCQHISINHSNYCAMIESE